MDEVNWWDTFEYVVCTTCHGDIHTEYVSGGVCKWCSTPLVLDLSG